MDKAWWEPAQNLDKAQGAAQVAWPQRGGGTPTQILCGAPPNI